MLLLEGLHLHVAGFRTLLGRRSTTVKVAEGAMLGAHILGYLAAVFLVLSPVQAVAFLLLQQGVFGVYLGCSFAPNHKGMAVFGEDEKIDFLRRQVVTSRNIRGGWFTDFALGGLNYQIEHHLFPSMPRPSLRHAQEPVRAFCEQHGIAYHRDRPGRFLRPGSAAPEHGRRPAATGARVLICATVVDAAG